MKRNAKKWPALISFTGLLRTCGCAPRHASAGAGIPGRGSSHGPASQPSIAAKVVAPLLAALAPLAMAFALSTGTAEADQYVAGPSFPIDATSSEAPQGIATDSDGHVYVGTTNSDPAGDPGEIQSFDVKGGPIAAFGSGSFSGLAVNPNLTSQQKVSIDATGGTFALTFNGQTSPAIAAGASAEDIETALIAMPNLAPADVSAKGPDGGPWTVALALSLGAVPEMTADGSNLTGATETATVTTVTVGGDVYGMDAGLFSDPKEVLIYDRESGTARGSIPISGDTFNWFHIAADQTGNIYYPSDANDVVQRFRPDGSEITPPLATAEMTKPVSVAVDANDNVYVADEIAGVLKFSADMTPSIFVGPNAAPNGKPARAVAVDPMTDRVFIGNSGNGSSGLADFEITAYEPSGAEIGSFGAGDFSNGSVVPNNYPQIAVDGSTGTVYAPDRGGNRVNTYKLLPSPAVSTGGASEVKHSSAFLNATVNPNGFATACQFEYVPDAEFDPGFTSGTTVDCDPVAVGSDEQDHEVVSEPITGLAPETLYHFRIIAGNANGATEGTPQTFTTTAAPPEARTGAADVTGETTASLSATVDANGNEATCQFHYGTTDSYGSTVPCDVAAVTGGAATAVAANLADLTPDTTYHYRVSATNVGGTTHGDDRVFTTDAPPKPETKSTEPPSTEPPPQAPAPPVFGGTARVGGVAIATGKVARLRMACRGGGACRGVVKLIARVRIRKVARRDGKRRVVRRVKNLVIGKARVRLAAGTVRTVRVRLNRRGLRLVRRARARGLRVRVAGPGVQNRAVRIKPRSTGKQRPRSGNSGRSRRR